MRKNYASRKLMFNSFPKQCAVKLEKFEEMVLSKIIEIFMLEKTLYPNFILIYFFD